MRARCLAHVALQQFRDPASLFPPPDRAGITSPASSVLSGCSDFPPPVMRRFVSSLRGTMHCCGFARQRGVAVGRLLVGTHAGASILCLRPRSWRRLDLSGSSATHSRTCPALRPRRIERVRPLDALDVAFRALHDVGSAFRPLSRLNHTACSFAVYASQLGSLRSHHARLAFR